MGLSCFEGKEKMSEKISKPYSEQFHKFNKELIKFAKSLPPPSGDPFKDFVQRIIPFHRKYEELLRKYPKVEELAEKMSSGRE